jgi:RNA polymerase sigma-70 factor (ECF subfamily)
MKKELDARFEALYKRFYGDVVRFLRLHMGIDKDTARDLARDAFVRVYLNMATLRADTEGAQWAFLKTTAVRVVLNHRRRQRIAHPPTEIPLEDLPSPENAASRDLFTDLPASSPEEVALRRDIIWRLQDAIPTLPPRQQDALRLRIPGLSYEKIAAAMGEDVQSVKTLLRDARRRLRVLLEMEPTGIDWPEVPGDAGGAGEPGGRR